MAHWISDNELVGEFGMAWLNEVDLVCDDFSIAGRASMTEKANYWLEHNNKPMRVVDCADGGNELLWLVETKEA